MPKVSDADLKAMQERMRAAAGIKELQDATRALRPPPEPSRRRKMNKLEAAYALELEALKATGYLARIRYEGITLLLGDDLRFTPDFYCVTAIGQSVFHEVKGPHAWEDSIVKIRVAATMYPEFSFFLVRREGRTGPFVAKQIRRAD